MDVKKQETIASVKEREVKFMYCFKCLKVLKKSKGISIKQM